jgi:tetratricopeptide (TPR) repeat protein
MNNLAIVARYEGNFDESAALLEEVLRLDREWGYEPDTALVAGNLAMSVLGQGHHVRALVLLTESLGIFWRNGNTLRCITCVSRMAAVSSARGDHARAARLLGAAQALRDALGAALRPFDKADEEQLATTLSDALGEQLFGAEWSTGQSMNLAQAVEYALSSSEFRRKR